MNYLNTFSHDSDIVLRVTAKALSLVSVGGLLLFIVGEGFDPTTLTIREWLLFAFFPSGVMIGLLIAWKNELLGSLITLGCLAGFYFVHGLLTGGGFPRGWAFFAFSAPGFLFLAHWLLTRRSEP